MLNRTPLALARLPIIISFLCVSSVSAATSGLKVLHAFGLGSMRGGSNLNAGLLLDPTGSLYGAAYSGGAYGWGTVYKISPGPQGTWSTTVIYNFKGGPHDGGNPHATLIRDSGGNLYGTTSGGGLGSKACNAGCGIVFELTQAPGSWRETVLYRFTGGPDGASPYAGVVLDPAGNLYGATTAGGSGQFGVVYKLAPSPGTLWRQTVLYSFGGVPDGSSPFAAPVLDALGNIYGTTYTGGTKNNGSVYRLTPSGGASWSEQILHSFGGGNDGINPGAPLIFDQSGDLYGTTVLGGGANCGIAFQLRSNANGTWAETLLHTFLGITAQDGENPNGLVFDALGNLYGTSLGGGVDNPGTIFKLTPQGGGSWLETVLYSFTAGDDGAYPAVGPTIDSSGNLYGTTLWGGPAGDTIGGVAFEFIP